MLSSLPRHPSVDHLKKQAKMLLAAQRRGVPASCALFGRLRRFANLTEEEILSASVSLAEAQLALAMQYGYGSWKELTEEARSHPPSTEYSLQGVRDHAEAPIPDYAGAGVPLAVVAAMNHAGISVGFMEFAAASGWAFSFGYRYEDISPAFMAVRGKPGSDSPLEVFSFLPEAHGLGYEMALTGEPDQLWDFVKLRVDSGIPVMSEHMDGGLITAYREWKGNRQLFFDGTVCAGWIEVNGFNPYAVYSFVKEGEVRAEDEITRAALSRAAEKGKAHDWNGVPQGMAALRAYLQDVLDPSKDFEETEEWFCWATFERLMARRCSEFWLSSLVERHPGEAGKALAAAAVHYGKAFQEYDRFLGETQGCDPPRPTLKERARAPERIKACAPLLERGIEEEALGLGCLGEAVALLD